MSTAIGAGSRRVDTREAGRGEEPKAVVPLREGVGRGCGKVHGLVDAAGIGSAEAISTAPPLPTHRPTYSPLTTPKVAQKTHCILPQIC